MAVFTMATVLVRHASATEGGLDATVLNITVMTYTTVLVYITAIAWDQMCVNVHWDLL